MYSMVTSSRRAPRVVVSILMFALSATASIVLRTAYPAQALDTSATDAPHCVARSADTAVGQIGCAESARSTVGGSTVFLRPEAHR